MGGSYGGFMTGWLASHAASGSRPRSWSGRSPRGTRSPGPATSATSSPTQYLGADPAGRGRQSPLAYADKIDLPTLIIHSEHDWRCPVEQAQRLYVALKLRGVETELLLFPGEGHELSRSGRPQHRLARLEHLLRWWARWLLTPQNPGAAE